MEIFKNMKVLETLNTDNIVNKTITTDTATIKDGTFTNTPKIGIHEIISVNVLDTRLSAYTLTTNLVANYYNKTVIDSTFTGYYDKGDIDTIISNYSTTAQITTILEDYVTATALGTTLDDYPTNDDITNMNNGNKFVSNIPTSDTTGFVWTDELLTVTHTKDKSDCIVSVISNSTGEQYLVDMKVVDSNNITLDFSNLKATITNNDLKLTIAFL